MSDVEDQQLVLQYFLSHKILSEEKIYQHYPKERFDELVHAINKQLQNLHLEIKSIRAEEDGSVYWGIVNLKNDELSQIATHYLKVEVDLFKLIVSTLRITNLSKKQIIIR